MKMQIAFLGFLLALSTAATAQEISYEYIEGLYAHSEYDDNSVWGESLEDAESEGGYINLSVAPPEQMYTKFGLGYNAVEDTGIDIVSGTAAVGMHMPMDDCVDLYFGILGAYGRASDLNFPPPNVADSTDDVDGYGLGAEVGVRARAGANFEFEVNGTYVNLFGGDVDDASDDTDDFNATATVRFYPVQQFSVSAGYGYAFGNEVGTYLLGVRYDFCCF